MPAGNELLGGQKQPRRADPNRPLRRVAIAFVVALSAWVGFYIATYDAQGRCLEGEDVMGCQGVAGLVTLGVWLLLGCGVFVLFVLTVVFAADRLRHRHSDDGRPGP